MILKKANLIFMSILTDNLKFADANIYGGTKEFFINYLVPEAKKTNDSLNRIFENCVANATLKASIRWNVIIQNTHLCRNRWFYRY